MQNCLGFSKVQNNVLYVQNSRGKIESVIIAGLSQIMLDLSKLANDVILFSTAEFGFLKLSKEICFGSSIMPQKHNPCVLEIIRAKSKKVQAMLFQTLTLSSSVGSGYHRDLQLTKQPLIESFEETGGSVKAMQIVFKNLKVNKEKCIFACSIEIFAADAALKLVGNGVPFREAYQKIAKNMHKLSAVDAVQNIKSKRLQGATGNLGLEKIEATVDAKEKKLKVESSVFSGICKQLLEEQNL